MGEVEEQRYICKLCSKSCVSGKSLGGHMRSHLGLIAASKKAAKAEAEIKIDDDQALLSEEMIKIEEFGDGDQSNSYELRENPKKSFKFSDPKHGVLKNLNTCKECDKVFPSSRALSGHMRCHSIKNNKQVHLCKKCGRGFDSIKAMFGHMKSHSKKSMVANDSTESLSDLENFCPVRRKRSRIRYKSSPNPSFSDLNVPDSVVDEAEEAAACLIMLSRGGKDFYDSVYFETESSIRSKECDVENKKLDHWLSGGSAKNVTEFDDFDSKFVNEDQINVDNVYDDGWVSVHKVIKTEETYGNDDSWSSDSTKSAEFDEGSAELLESNSGKRVISSVYKCDSEKTCENEGNLEMMEHFEMRDMKGFHSECTTDQSTVKFESTERKVYECTTCFKAFPSGQALGGHKRAHYNAYVESKNREAMATNQEAAFDLNLAANGEGITSEVVGISSWWIQRHEALVFDLV